MVEFGLKLEDNKVADWGENYIQYEKLKAILKRCGAAVKRYDELAERRPETAAYVATEYYQGLPTPKSSAGNLRDLSESRNTSYNSLTALESIAEGEKNEVGGSSEFSQLKGKGKDESNGFSGPNPDYGTTKEINTSTRSNASQRSDIAPTSIRRMFGKAASGVSDYFQDRYEKQVRDALKDIDKVSTEFDNFLLADIKRVNDFYNDKLEELEERVVYLRESVAQTLQAHNHFGSGDIIHEDDEMEDDSKALEMETPLIERQKKYSNPMDLAKDFAKSLSQRIARVRQDETTDEVNESSKLVKVPAPPLLTSERADMDEMDEEAVKKVREADSIQRALVDHYRTAKLLHNFAIMNYTGFVKIVKKHDKTMSKRDKGRHKQAIAPEKICNEGKAVEILITRMEKLYAAWFCDRSISEARAQMLTKKGDGLEMDWSQLRLGYRMGMCSILGLWVCWDCVWGLLSQGRSTIGGREAFPVFRACGGLLQLQWCWGFSVWVWTRYRINYIFLFDFDPNLVATPLAIFNEAVDNTLFYLLTTLLYYKAGAHDIPGSFPAGVFPFILVMYTVYQLIFPLRVRVPMWKSIWQVVSTPLTSPSFFHGYVGDIFTSMVKVFQDLVWTFFFIFSGDWLISEDVKASTRHLWSKTNWYSHLLIPFVTLLPLWFRFNQCLRRYADTGSRFPHLPNAFKYALSQLVTLFGAFHPLYMNRGLESDVFQSFWMFLFVASSLYSFSWDVFMDWGLGNPKYQFLAQRLMYPRRAMYYSIIVVDLVLRFAWVLTLLPPQSGAKFALPAYLTLVSMMLEILRRTLWGFLRLENEHRSNTAGYRRVDFVPLHFSTGHKHGYKHEQTHRGSSVLLEVTGVTLLVLCAAVVSVVAAQHATERASMSEL